MINNNVDTNTKKLIEAFMNLKRCHWTGAPHGDVKHSEMFVLFYIKKHNDSSANGVKISEISSHMKVSNPTTTQTINRLEEKGYVERKLDKEDRRAVRVILTQKGEQAILEASESFVKFFEGLANHLGNEKSLLLAEIINEAIEYINENKLKK